MSPMPDDARLSAFLRQYRPEVPPPAPDLEDAIMAMVESTPQHRAIADASMERRSRSTWRSQWFIPSAIAASLLVAIVGYRALKPVPQMSEAELAELEAFIETTWQDPVAEQPVVYAEELLTQPDPAVN